VKSNCADCNPCPHGKRKYFCAACNPCPHGKVKYDCAGLRRLPAWEAETQLRKLQTRLTA
jgi:hypothetical protein